MALIIDDLSRREILKMSAIVSRHKRRLDKVSRLLKRPCLRTPGPNTLVRFYPMKPFDQNADLNESARSIWGRAEGEILERHGTRAQFEW